MVCYYFHTHHVGYVTSGMFELSSFVILFFSTLEYDQLKYIAVICGGARVSDL